MGWLISGTVLTACYAALGPAGVLVALPVCFIVGLIVGALK